MNKEFKALTKDSKYFPKDRTFVLDEGYYSMTYLCHLVSNRVKYLISKDEKSIMFKNCLIISLSQISLNFMIGQDILTTGYFVQCTY